MTPGRALRGDRAHLIRLFALFDRASDTAHRMRLMDEALATVEAHRANTQAVVYLLHGVSAQEPRARPKLRAVLSHLRGLCASAPGWPAGYRSPGASRRSERAASGPGMGAQHRGADAFDA